MRICILFFLLGILTAGCFQAHSDDDLRTVPVTNNPNLIPDSHKMAQIPGMY